MTNADMESPLRNSLSLVGQFINHTGLVQYNLLKEWAALHRSRGRRSTWTDGVGVTVQLYGPVVAAYAGSSACEGLTILEIRVR